jgi:hypothetical protein
MKLTSLLFLFCAIAVELSPLFLLRLIPAAEKTKIMRIFTTLVVSMLLLYFKAAHHCFPSRSCNVVFLLALLAFYGVFPFSRWLGDAIVHFPRKILALHFLLINGTPLLLADGISSHLSAFCALKVVIFIHLALYIFRMVANRDLEIKVPCAIVLMNGLLPGLLCSRQLIPFFCAVASECALLFLLPRKASQ